MMVWAWGYVIMLHGQQGQGKVQGEEDQPQLRGRHFFYFMELMTLMEKITLERYVINLCAINSYLATRWNSQTGPKLSIMHDLIQKILIKWKIFGRLSSLSFKMSLMIVNLFQDKEIVGNNRIVCYKRISHCVPTSEKLEVSSVRSGF